MKLNSITLAIALLSGTAFAQQPLSDVVRDDWAANDHWYDGKAEMATYVGERIIYGKLRAHTHRLITVKEDFTQEYWVKADWPYGNKPILPVVKQNQVATVPTENYPYQFMNSVFFELSDIDEAVKMTSSSTEWCGITMREFHFFPKTPKYIYTSYWDGEGTGELDLSSHNDETYLEEELPLLVRAIEHQEGLVAQFALYQNMTTSRAPEPRAVGAQLQVSQADEDLTVPIGNVARDDLWQVEVQVTDGRRMTFHVGRQYPNLLYRYDLGDGRTYELEALERRAYWR